MAEPVIVEWAAAMDGFSGRVNGGIRPAERVVIARIGQPGLDHRLAAQKDLTGRRHAGVLMIGLAAWLRPTIVERIESSNGHLLVVVGLEGDRASRRAGVCDGYCFSDSFPPDTDSVARVRRCGRLLDREEGAGQGRAGVGV